MSRHENILLASAVAAILLLGGTPHQSAGVPLSRSSQGSHHSFLGSICPHFSSLGYHENTLSAAVDKDSEDSAGSKEDGKDDKDDEDGKLKELWDSVQLG